MLRVHALGKTSFWNDEICSVLYERGQTSAIFATPQGYFEHAPTIASNPGTRPLREVWTTFDSNPPLYATVLRIWWWIFGEGDVSARALSVALSVATILAVFDFARLCASIPVALWACALCAASPPQVHYAQEARPYALAGLLGVLACDVALRLSRYGGSAVRYLLLFLLCAATLLTHFFVIGGIAAIALFALIELRGRLRFAVASILLLALSIELWAVPIMSHEVAIQGVHGGLAWLNEPRAGLFTKSLIRVASLPAQYLIQPLESEGLAMTPSVVILLLPLFLYKRHPGLLLAGSWSLGIIGVVTVSDLWMGHGALAYIRYTLAASPMVFVSFATIAAVAGRWTRNLLPGLTLAGALLAVPQVYYDELWQKTESRLLAQDVRTHLKDGDVLIVGSLPDMGFYSAGTQYLALDFYGGPLPTAVAILEAPASAAVQRSIWSHRHVWVVEAFYGFNASAYLGPCRLTPVATTRYHCGRLYLAEPLP